MPTAQVSEWKNCLPPTTTSATVGFREEVAAAKRVSSAIVEHAQALGGTCTGEHGVGTGKLHYLEAEHGAAGLALMHSIKQAFDPKGILNPGKLGSKILS
jgi:FAD/FMN-containing dehydrogenase